MLTVFLCYVFLQVVTVWESSSNYSWQVVQMYFVTEWYNLVPASGSDTEEDQPTWRALRPTAGYAQQ